MDKRCKLVPVWEHTVAWKGLKKQGNPYWAPLFFGELRANNTGMIRAAAAYVLNKAPE